MLLLLRLSVQTVLREVADEFLRFCAASLQIEPMMDSMSAAVISSLLIFKTMSSAPQPACRMPNKRNSSDQRDDRDSGDLVASLNRHPGQRWSPRGFFAFLPWLVLHSVPPLCP